MRIRYSIAAVMVVSWLCTVSNAQQIPPLNETLADNAALVYWQAFALLPELNDAQTKSLDDVLRGQEANDEVSKTLRQASESLRQMRRARKYSQCEWGLEYERGIEMTLPHLSQSRELSKVACARARIRFEEGKRQAAIDDVMAAMTMARRIGENAAVISLLVDYAIESQATDVLLKYLPQLETPELEMLGEQVSGLPASKTMADGWRMEQELLLGWFIRELQKPDGKDRVLKVFADQDDPNIVALKKLPQQELERAATKLRGVYERIIAVQSLSPSEVDEFVEKLTAEVESLGAERHFAALIIPSAQNLRRTEAVHQARLAMLLAAIAVAEDGEDALKRDGLEGPLWR